MSTESTWRDEIERVADEIEAIVRTKLEWREKDGNIVDHAIGAELFAKAWDLKQYARAGSPSEGI